jgi:hypothetical protein
MESNQLLRWYRSGFASNSFVIQLVIGKIMISGSAHQLVVQKKLIQ